MNRLQFTAILLKPSVSSSIIVAVVSLLMIIVSLWVYSLKTGLLYEYLLGPGSSAQLLETSETSIIGMQEAVFGNDALNTVMLYAFWMLIGIGVYLVINGLQMSYEATDRILRQKHYVNHRKQMLEKSFSHRILLRGFVTMIWFIYSVIYFRVIVQFVALTSTSALRETASAPLEWWYLIIAFIVSVVSLHLHVILLRLFLLRPRVINGWEDVMIEDVRRPL
jgi:hypothetical protein